MTEPYRSLDQKPYDSYYFHAETVIDHPVAKVWPHALMIGRWMSDHRLETIAGKPGNVGHFERVHPHDLPPQTPSPRYHLYEVAQIVPFKSIVLEVFPERGGSYGDATEKTSFDAILLTDLGARTHLTFLAIDVDLQKTKPAAAEREKRAAKEQRMRERLHKYFDNLARQVAEAR
jgi:hypothetical protein